MPEETKQTQAEEIAIDEMASFCKRKGLVYPTSEIYGSLAGFWDYGPYGVELVNNLKAQWWKYFVQERDDMAGIDGSIITHPKVWRASGHLECFGDLMLTCSKCAEKVRADHFIEDNLDIAADGMKADEINALVKEHGLKCPNCEGAFKEATDFNLLFETNVGPVVTDKSKAYLRGETAQSIFCNYKMTLENARLSLPAGIAQIGKAFRNEISPRNFLFRCREFEMMEIEFFVHPEKQDDCPYLDDVKDHSLFVYTVENQEKGEEAKEMKVGDILSKKVISTSWHTYWLVQLHKWFLRMGAKSEHFRIRQHLPKEKSHYATDTWDLEYKFPFGYKELVGMANRGDFDIRNHQEHSKKNMEWYDEETKSKVLPVTVAEPSLGVGRALLVLLYDAYHDDKERGNVVLHFHPRLAPIKVAVLPLVNKEGLPEIAQKIFKDLKKLYNVTYDKGGSVGRRYARNDEIGTPFCVTVDFDTKEDNTVTLRDRDSTDQVRIPIDKIEWVMYQLIQLDIPFSKVSTEY